MLSVGKGCKAIWHQRLARNINPFMVFARSWFCPETSSTKKSGVVNSKDSTSPPHSKNTWLNTKGNCAPNSFVHFADESHKNLAMLSSCYRWKYHHILYAEVFQGFFWKFWWTSFFKCILLALMESPVCPLCILYFALKNKFCSPGTSQIEINFGRLFT